MLPTVRALGRPTAVCTIYDAVPILGDAERAAVAGFNDQISRLVIRAGLPLLDLRLICDRADDFSPLSPVEPSVTGGSKIADAICRLVAGHDFATARTAVWV